MKEIAISCVCESHLKQISMTILNKEYLEMKRAAMPVTLYLCTVLTWRKEYTVHISVPVYYVNCVPVLSQERALCKQRVCDALICGARCPPRHPLACSWTSLTCNTPKSQRARLAGLSLRLSLRVSLSLSLFPVYVSLPSVSPLPQHLVGYLLCNSNFILFI